MDLADVEREALHDWLATRPDPEPPDRCEYADLEPNTLNLEPCTPYGVHDRELAPGPVTPPPK